MTVPALPPLPERLAALAAADWPRFSDTEMDRRRIAIEDLMASTGVGYLLVYGAQWNGTGIPWLTHWPTTSEAALVVSPGAQHNLYIQFHNHVPQAMAGATGCAVHWGDSDTMATVIADFQARGGRYMSLAHNGHSQFSDSNTGERDGVWLHNGLSDLGREAIVEMNRVGMMVDSSIVVLENIYRLRQEGHSRAEAARLGAHRADLRFTNSEGHVGHEDRERLLKVQDVGPQVGSQPTRLALGTRAAEY